MKKEEREAMLREHLAEMKKYENEIWARGIKYIAGVDEVGRGPLAGQLWRRQWCCRRIFQ